MLDRWGDFDSDVLLNAGLPSEDHDFLDGLSPDKLSRSRTSDGSSRQSTRGTRESTTAPSLLTRRQRRFQHVDQKNTCAMFTWMLESESLRHTIFDILEPIWIAVQPLDTPTTTCIMQPEQFDQISQRLAKRFPGSLIPSHGVTKERRIDSKEFCSIVATMITPKITLNTIPECLDAVRSLVNQFVFLDSKINRWQLRGLEDIESTSLSTVLPVLKSIQSPATLSVLPAVNQSLVLTEERLHLKSGSSSGHPLSREMATEARAAHEEQLKQKLRLRKYWSSEASNTAALILPDEIPLFNREDLQSRAKSREQNQFADETLLQVDSRQNPNENPPPSRSKDECRTITPSGRLRGLHQCVATEVVVENHNDDELVLVCSRCEKNEAVIWCSRCHSVLCIPCWPAEHSTQMPLNTSPTKLSSSTFMSCVQTQSVGKLHGPPLPLVRTPPINESQQPDQKRKLNQYRGKPMWTKQLTTEDDKALSKLQVKNSLQHSTSMPIITTSSVAKITPFVAPIIQPTIKAKPKPTHDPWGRTTLKQHAIDLNEMLPTQTNHDKRK